MTARQLARARWFVRELWQRAVAARSAQLASALAYTSILALVPLLVRDLDELSLLDLARLVPPSLMVAEAAQNLPPEDVRFRQLLEQHRHGVERDFSCSLASLMADVDA